MQQRLVGETEKIFHIFLLKTCYLYNNIFFAKFQVLIFIFLSFLWGWENGYSCRC
jgi:hypothetical protein